MLFFITLLPSFIYLFCYIFFFFYFFFLLFFFFFFYVFILCIFFFFFQAEDGIRDRTVTGVQTCALPILKQLDERRFECGLRARDPEEGEREQQGDQRATCSWSHCEIFLAVARPSAMQSGMPTPRNPLPVTNRPGCRASARSMASIRARWPTSCCALARSNRYTRVRSGSPVIPSRGVSAASDSVTSSASDRSSAARSRAPPTNVRSSTRPSGARWGHFDESHDPARMPEPSTFGTTNPDPFKGCARASRLNASAMVAVEEYGISPHKRASSASRSPMS